MSENPYTTPQTSPEMARYDGTQPIVELASRWARLGASLIDTIIMIVIFLPLLFTLFALGIFPGLADTGDFLTNIEQSSESLIGSVVTAVLGASVYLLLNGYLLLKSGQSIGKKALSIQIVDAETRQLLPASRVIGLRYLVTSLVAQIPMIGQLLSVIDVMFIFGQEKRCVHDLIANSIVIKK